MTPSCSLGALSTLHGACKAHLGSGPILAGHVEGLGVRRRRITAQGSETVSACSSSGFTTIVSGAWCSSSVWV